MKKRTLNLLCAVVHLPKTTSLHIFGENHDHKHKMGVGVMFMAIGTGISRLLASNPILHFIMEMLGFMVHGIGLVPIAEFMANLTKQNEYETIKKSTEGDSGAGLQRAAGEPENVS
jgi:accessory gene regulator protein AgrB